MIGGCAGRLEDVASIVHMPVRKRPTFAEPTRVVG